MSLVRKLQDALAEVRALRGILPICAHCRRIRSDESCWETVEGYLSRRTEARFSHGICPSCYEREVEPELRAMEGGDGPGEEGPDDDG